jgi:uncharacterized membrane protein (DUF485 family)
VAKSAPYLTTASRSTRRWFRIQCWATPPSSVCIRTRRRFSWSLTAAMLAIYFGFILTLAFRPDLLARQLVAGQPMSVGIPIGFGMFAFTFALVAIYVYRTNAVYDRLITEVRNGELQ